MSTTYYATVKHHSITSFWTPLEAETEIAAKREAWKLFGDGFMGHRVEVQAAQGANTPGSGYLVASRTITAGNSRWIAA